MARDMTALGSSGMAALGLASLAATRLKQQATSRLAKTQNQAASSPSAPARLDPDAAVHAARRLNRAAGVLAASVLADSAVEHYRGQFHNRAMVTPLVTASLSLAVSAHGNADKRPVAHRARDGVYLLAAATGVIGTGFHLYNVLSKPGGLSWQNLFYSAPLGAPAALSLSGAMGFLAERVRDTSSGSSPMIAGVAAGRVVGVATSVGLLGTMSEAGLLHFRGNYQNPFMYVPVSLPPVAAAALGLAALGRTGQRSRWARTLLRLTAAMGYAGAGFHLRGVARQMGGWRNWSQNILNGPPVPAPPSFTGLAMAGLAALGLLEDHPDD